MVSNEFTFGKFSKNAFYGDLNARLVDMTEVGSNQRIVDLACGSGGVSRLILERLRNARESVVISIDHSATALKQAMDDLREFRDSAVQFVQSQVELVSDAVKESVDTVFFCNAIHYIPDKDALIAEISRALKPGGKFAFNTSFFEGGQPPDTELFYRRWMLRSIRILRKEYGLLPVRAEKVEARHHLTPEEYTVLLESHNFQIARQEIDLVQVPIEGWLDISEFDDFIKGIMPGVPLDKASAALKRGVKHTYEDMGISYVNRNWLDMVAIRG